MVGELYPLGEHDERELAVLVRFGLDRPPMFDERLAADLEAAHLNPDCAVGKHNACRGDAWCLIEDAGVSCGCGCHEGPSNG